MNRGYWPLRMTLDMPQSRVLFPNPGISTVLSRLLYLLWDNPFAMFVYAMLQLMMVLSKLGIFVFFFYFHCTSNTTVRVLWQIKSLSTLVSYTVLIHTSSSGPRPIPTIDHSIKQPHAHELSTLRDTAEVG